ncbi:MAG: acetate--CoA ligase family protein [Desulforhabdus sp.]|jgi:acetyltransferase|nr:acetate--CoA ligase family protein [Desulforhabdus sp.]
MSALDCIFSPHTVAVIGASTTPGKVGHDIFLNILRGGYTGTLYPVNPSARSILSVRAYPAVAEIPDEVELAIIILPPAAALEAVKESVAGGVKGIVIVSAGFKEVGGKGVEIEQQIVSICREAGVRLVGPNCLGVINPLPSVKLNASFSPRMPAPGKISFISQSGALCTSVLDFAADRDFGFSKFISIGNKADVDELDLLEYLHEDIDTEVIMIYLEELRRGPEFIEAVKEITSGRRRTPVLVIKSGRTSAGARAAASHTGALAGSEAVYESIFEQSGIIRANSINELFDFASAFTYKTTTALGKISRKLPEGNRVAIVTNAGGPGIVATDMTISSGLELAQFQPHTVEQLAENLPSTANLHNPVDVIGDATQDRYEHALTSVLKDEGVDGALVILTPQSMTNALAIAKSIVRVARGSRKPMLCCFMGVIDVSEGVKYLQEHGYPVFRFPEDAAKSFGALYQYSRWLNREALKPYKLDHDTRAAKKIVSETLAAGKTYLGELGGLDLLKCYGFKVLPTELARTPQEAEDIAERIGFPVVLKIVSDQIIHKSDAGGVLVKLQDRHEVTEGFQKIVERARAYNAEATIEGVLVQQMAPKGEEVIFGMNRYPIFGPLLMFGMGGIFVEVFQDVRFSLAPIRREEAVRMIHGIKGFKLLNGFRGRPRADIETLEKLLVSLSDMAVNHPEIIEMDLNPLLVHQEREDATVADCRIILKKPSHSASPKDK